MNKNTLAFTLLFLVSFLSKAQEEDTTAYVILISFDGFRSDYVERYDLTNFKKFIKNGSAAEGLIPSFPSKTFPNHYSIVTGLYPGNHGLVDNHFFDPEMKKVYTMKNRDVVTNPAFYGGTPLWKLCRQNGIKSASYFWIGSEVNDEASRPDIFLPYNESVPFHERFNHVITWLRFPGQERPHFITLYFSSPDHESHEHGPWSEETKKRLVYIDSLLGNFLRDVRDTHLPVNIILVSDHGMAGLKRGPETYIFLDELISPEKGITVVNGGTQAHVYTQSPKQTDSLEHLLSKAATNFTIVERQNFPDHWHYENKRSGDLLIVADPGTYIMSGSKQSILTEQKEGTPFGVHGYDPEIVSDMYGIFYAAGPRIKNGVKIPAFQNIHIYPFIAGLLGLKTPPIDGKTEILQKIRK